MCDLLWIMAESIWHIFFTAYDVTLYWDIHSLCNKLCNRKVTKNFTPNVIYSYYNDMQCMDLFSAASACRTDRREARAVRTGKGSVASLINFKMSVLSIRDCLKRKESYI